MANSERRSLVRVKLWTTLGIFLLCGLAIKFQVVHGRFELAVALLAVFQPPLVFFIWCEKCHTPVISLSSAMNPVAAWRLLVQPKKCPTCGMERV